MTHTPQPSPSHFKASAFGTGAAEPAELAGPALFRRSGGRKPSSTASEASVVNSCQFRVEGGEGMVKVCWGKHKNVCIQYINRNIYIVGVSLNI